MQRLDGSGFIRLILIDLRYSPSPLETVFVSSITKDNDYKRKCLYESGMLNMLRILDLFFFIFNIFVRIEGKLI